MENSKTEELLHLIGSLLAEDEESPLNETLLHAEVGEGYVAPSIFKDRGNFVLYRWPDLDRLGDAILDLWYSQDTKPYWRELDYVVRNGKFTVTYDYAGRDIGSDDGGEWRDRVVARHFGDKPIVYPPWEQDDDAFDFEL